MVNRLVLDLIQGADTRGDSEFRTRTGVEPPMFATGPFLGNIGGPLRTLSDDTDDDYLEEDDAEYALSHGDDAVEQLSVDRQEKTMTVGGSGVGRGNVEDSV